MTSVTLYLSNLNALQPYIDRNGLVDYNRLKDDEWLRDQINYIKLVNIENMSHDEEFAFWLNAYNILTLKGVCMELDLDPHWKGNVSYWSKVRFFFLRRFNVAGRKMNLWFLENKILRGRFKDPRIHFAINCASKSCPNLPERVFAPKDLDRYLNMLSINFINDKDHVFLNEEEKILYLNPIFKWYKKDFKAHGGVKKFISKYWQQSEESIFETFQIKYLEYDWSINSQDSHKKLLKIDVISKT
ncbi:MAG: DUF547 domain-containing protein [Promethearchaeota archaeon]